MGPSADNSRLLLRCIDSLYASALDPLEWTTFLSQAATLFRSDNAFVCQIDHHNCSLDYVGLPQDRRDRFPVQRYARLLDDDPRRGIFDAQPGQATHCRMGLSETRLRNSHTYRNYLHPLDIEYTMVTCLPVREGFTHDLGLTRGRERAVFDSDDCDLLNELVPHLKRAFEISRALPGKTIPRFASARQGEHDLDVLKHTFALPPSQARLVCLLVDGKTVKQAALEMGLTEGTARQYLKRVFERTGARRQADLIRIAGKTLSRQR